MKTFSIDSVRDMAESLKGDDLVAEIGPRHMAGNENNYTLKLNGTKVFGSASSDAIGGFLYALMWLGPVVIQDVFFREEDK